MWAAMGEFKFPEPDVVPMVVRPFLQPWPSGRLPSRCVRLTAEGQLGLSLVEYVAEGVVGLQALGEHAAQDG